MPARSGSAGYSARTESGHSGGRLPTALTSLLRRAGELCRRDIVTAAEKII